jgi:hypothetical protein
MQLMVMALSDTLLEPAVPVNGHDKPGSREIQGGYDQVAESAEPTCDIDK